LLHRQGISRQEALAGVWSDKVVTPDELLPKARELDRGIAAKTDEVCGGADPRR